MKKIDMMLKMPGELLKEMAIDRLLESLQSLIGGLIDMVALPEGKGIDIILA